MRPFRLLLLNDDPPVLASMQLAAADAGMRDDPRWVVRPFTERATAEQEITDHAIDLAVIDLALRGQHDEDGIEVIYRLHREQPDCRIIGLSHILTNNAGVRAMEAGAHDFLSARWTSVNWAILLRNKIEIYKSLVERLAKVRADLAGRARPTAPATTDGAA